MQDPHARAMNRAWKLHGTMDTSVLQPKPKLENVAKKYPAKITIGRVCKEVNNYLKDKGLLIDKSDNPVVNALTGKMLKIALRDNDEDPTIYCPDCRKSYKVPLETRCPVHIENMIPVKFPNIAGEKNSVQVGLKMMDKFFPNLNSINGKIDVGGTITTMSAKMVEIIFRYVPGESRNACMTEIDQLLEAVQNATNESE